MATRTSPAPVSDIPKQRMAPATSPSYKPTAGALLDLSIATENGSLRDHPLQKTGDRGVYKAADGRFLVTKIGGKWTVSDTKTGTDHPATSYENCRLVVNQVMNVRLDKVPAVTDRPKSGPRKGGRK